MDLFPSFRSPVPGRQSLSYVCSNVTFLCGMVCFTIGLTGLVNKSWFPDFSAFSIVCAGSVGKPIIGVKVHLNTVINVVVNAGTIRVVLGPVFLSF